MSTKKNNESVNAASAASENNNASTNAELNIVKLTKFSANIGAETIAFRSNEKNSETIFVSHRYLYHAIAPLDSGLAFAMNARAVLAKDDASIKETLLVFLMALFSADDNGNHNFVGDVTLSTEVDNNGYTRASILNIEIHDISMVKRMFVDMTGAKLVNIEKYITK